MVASRRVQPIETRGSSTRVVLAATQCGTVWRACVLFRCVFVCVCVGSISGLYRYVRVCVSMRLFLCVCAVFEQILQEKFGALFPCIL